MSNVVDLNLNLNILISTQVAMSCVIFLLNKYDMLILIHMIHIFFMDFFRIIFSWIKPTFFGQICFLKIFLSLCYHIFYIFYNRNFREKAGSVKKNTINIIVIINQNASETWHAMWVVPYELRKVKIWKLAFQTKTISLEIISFAIQTLTHCLKPF